MASTIDYFHRNTLMVIEEAGEMAAISVMSALLAPTWCSPVKRGALNQYNMLIAPSRAGKEAYTLGARELLADICPQLVARQKPRSDVGFFRILRQCPGSYFHFDELGQWFKAMLKADSSYQKMIGSVFLEAYSGPSYIDGGANKNEKDSTEAVEFPIPSIIGGATPESLKSLSGIEAFRDDGLFTRFEVYIHNAIVTPSFDVDNSPAKPHEIEALVEAGARTIAKINAACPKPDGTFEFKFGPRESFEIDDNAFEYWKEIAINRSKEGQLLRGLWGSIIAGMPQRIMRTSCCLAAYRGDRTVNVDDISIAYCYHMRNVGLLEPHIKLASEDTTVGRLCETIKDYLLMYGKKSRTEIRNGSAVRYARKQDLDEALNVLLEMGQIVPTITKTNGRSRTEYELVKEKLRIVNDNNSDFYFDQSIENRKEKYGYPSDE